MSLLSAGSWTGQPLKVLSHPNNSMILCLCLWGGQRGAWLLGKSGQHRLCTGASLLHPPCWHQVTPPAPALHREKPWSTRCLCGSLQLCSVGKCWSCPKSHGTPWSQGAFWDWEQLEKIEARWLCVNDSWQVCFGTRGSLSPAQQAWPSCKAWPKGGCIWLLCPDVSVGQCQADVLLQGFLHCTPGTHRSSGVGRNGSVHLTVLL